MFRLCLMAATERSHIRERKHLGYLGCESLEWAVTAGDPEPKQGLTGQLSR